MEPVQHILIVDGNAAHARQLRHGLERAGFRVSVADGGAAMRQRLRRDPPDLVLIDIALPAEDGFALTRELRDENGLGIIIVSDRDDPEDRILGLELGADDYISRPFVERELLARIRSVLRRARPASSAQTLPPRSIARFRGWTLDLLAHNLTDPKGVPVYLTSYEFRLLTALVQSGSRVLARERILSVIAGREWKPTDRSIDVLIGKLRRKIEPEPDSPRLIRTIRGVGYQFAVPVEYE